MICPFGPNPLLGLPAGFCGLRPCFDTSKGIFSRNVVDNFLRYLFEMFEKDFDSGLSLSLFIHLPQLFLYHPLQNINTPHSLLRDAQTNEWTRTLLF